MASPEVPQEIAPTPAEVASRIRSILDDAVLGAFLYGSATLGGLRRHSDVDVLAVLGRRSTKDERRALVTQMLEISGSRASLRPGRPVELTLVVQSDVRPWRYPPRAEFQYGEWLRDDYERGTVPEPVESPDLAILLQQVLSDGKPLFGPLPAALIDRVPAADLRRAMVDTLPDLLADLASDRNVALTLARMWMTLETGRIEPKDVAADWALARIPRVLRSPLQHARAVYLDEEPDGPLDVAAVSSFADHVVGRIRSSVARGASAP